MPDAMPEGARATKTATKTKTGTGMRAGAGFAGAGRPVLSAATIEAGRALAPGWDIYALEADWHAYWLATGRPRLAAPARAFLGYVRMRVGRPPAD